MVVDAALLRRLYAVPPTEFVATRGVIVKELRAAKDRDTAAEVARLRRPSLPDWALNTVAADHPGATTDLLDAAARLRAAQAAAIEGRGGADVRGASGQLREHSQRVLALAEDVLARSGREPGAQLAALTARLAEVAGNESAAEQLRGGHLGSEDVETVGLFAGLSPPPGRPSRSSSASSTPARSTARKSGEARSSAGAPRPAPATTAPARTRGPDAATRRRLERAVTTARRARATAETALSKASTRVDSAGEAVTGAETVLDAARARLDAAEEQRRRAAEDAQRAAAVLDDATKALDAARARLDAADDLRRRAAEDAERAAAVLDEAEQALSTVTTSDG